MLQRLVGLQAVVPAYKPLYRVALLVTIYLSVTEVVEEDVLLIRSAQHDCPQSISEPYQIRILEQLHCTSSLISEWHIENKYNCCENK